MAKKKRGKDKKQKRDVGGDEVNDEELSSECSHENSTYARSTGFNEDAATTDKVAGEKGAEEKLDETIENLTEKRTTTRVEALETLVQLLLNCLTISTISSRRETMVANLLGCLRKPSEGEGSLAPRALAVMGLTLGPDQETFFLDVRSALQLLVKSGKHASTRSECLNALVTLCFVCAVEEEQTHQLMNLCESYFNTSCPSELCLSALYGWGLLASTRSRAYLVDDAFPQWHTVFVDMLDHADLAIRVASGENLALLFEAIHASGAVVAEQEAISERLLELSKESSKRTSKKERKEQRSNFREIVATVEEDVVPTLNLTIQNEPMMFESWVCIKQVNAMRNCLKTGFQEHLQFNAALRPIFNLPTIDPAGLNRKELIQEKRSKLAKSSDESKQRDVNLKDSRRRRQNQKDSFMEEY